MKNKRREIAIMTKTISGLSMSLVIGMLLTACSQATLWDSMDKGRSQPYLPDTVIET